MIAPWLKAHLEDTGVLANGIGRAARGDHCDHCQAVVVRGLTDPPMAILATVDPAPLTSVGEALALLAGRWTYDLIRRAGRFELDERDPWHIEGSPADTPDSWRRNSDVLAAHKCNTPQLPTRESRIR